jgi:hypothetical protein
MVSRVDEVYIVGRLSWLMDWSGISGLSEAGRVSRVRTLSQVERSSQVERWSQVSWVSGQDPTSELLNVGCLIWTNEQGGCHTNL